MHQSKLVRTLQILDGAELKRLFQFLKSPFYNANPAIVKLYLALRAHHPEFESLRLTKENLFKKLFPDRDYDHQKMLNLMSDFTALLEKYLTLLQLEKESTEQQKLLLRAYSGRPDCYAIFEKKVLEMDKMLDELPYRDELYFQEKKDLNLLYFGHPGTDMTGSGRNVLQSALEHFEASHVIASAKLKCAVNAFGSAVGESKAVKSYNRELASESPVLDIYEKLEVLQNAMDESIELQEVASNFMTHIASFRPDDKSNILKILLNHCNRLANKGKSEFIEISFDLYKVGLEYDSLLVQGKLKESTFHSIVTAGTFCGAFDWTKDFIDNYQNMLDARVRADALALAMGQWHFDKQEFEEALDVLQHAFSDPQDIFKAKALTIRAWYALFEQDDNYLELLLAQLDAFEKFTRRNKKVSERWSEAFLRFIAFTRKLALLRTEGKSSAKLKDLISEEPNVAFKSWLLKIK